MAVGEFPPGAAEHRFLVVGEALIDLVPAGEGSTFDSPWQAQTAGGPLNTAVALARLGRAVDFGAPLAEDAFGAQMLAHLEANGVGHDRRPAGSGPTALAVVSLDEQGKASYHFHAHGTATFDFVADRMPTPGPGKWLHVASLVLVVQPGADELLQWVRGTTGPLSVDVNVRTIVEPDPTSYWRRIEPWLTVVGERSGVVKGSDEDFDFLAAGAGLPGRSELVDLIAGLGASCVVTTLGADGATGMIDGQQVTVPGRPSEVVDTVAAGDTFMAGFLDAWTREPQDLTAALQRAVAAASVVVTRRGAQPPTSTEVDAILDGED